MLEGIRKDIDTGLREYLKTARMDIVKGSSAGLLYEGIRDFAERDGKRVRPMLMVISYMGYTRRKKAVYSKIIRCALSLELAHDFFLMHDDVIDDSDLRRGLPTLHKVFNKKLGRNDRDSLGPNLSIVAGDVLYTMAVETLMSFEEDPRRKQKALSQFLKMCRDTGIGEFLDVVNDISRINDISEEDILLTYTLKTARYTFEGPLLIGAVLAGREKKELGRLSRLGLALGRAFQIQDDLLDIFSTSKKIGKPVLSDLNESKKTLFARRAYENLNQRDRHSLKRIFEKDRKNYNDLVMFRNLIKKSEAHKYCIRRSEDLVSEAGALLAELGMKAEYKKALEDLVSKVFSKTEELKKLI